MTTDESVELVLGFPDEEKQEFGRASFPSKIGGKPVFLLDEPMKFPNCKRCQQRMRFLCQLYAPVNAPHGEAFHRTLYVFFCDSTSCLKIPGDESVCVLRAQLPRRNQIYSYNWNDENHNVIDVKGELCTLCGGASNERCSACKSVSYCSSTCQRIDWKLGHKLVCKNDDIHAVKRAVQILEEARKNYRFKEVAIETEGWSDTESEDDDDIDDEETAKAASIEGTMQDAGDEELPEELFKDNSDEVFDRFCKLTRDPPDQVVRYARGGNCVWMHSKGRCDDIDRKCEHCGGKLVFEFQVLPQALYYAEGREHRNVNSIGEVARRLRDGTDWGVIAVFTCTTSCVADGEYVMERAWLQPNI